MTIRKYVEYEIECDSCGESAVFDIRPMQQAIKEMKFYGWRLGKSLHEDYCIDCAELFKIRYK